MNDDDGKKAIELIREFRELDGIAKQIGVTAAKLRFKALITHMDELLVRNPKEKS